MALMVAVSKDTADKTVHYTMAFDPGRLSLCGKSDLMPVNIPGLTADCGYCVRVGSRP